MNAVAIELPTAAEPARESEHCIPCLCIVWFSPLFWVGLFAWWLA